MYHTWLAIFSVTYGKGTLNGREDNYHLHSTEADGTVIGAVRCIAIKN